MISLRNVKRIILEDRNRRNVHIDDSRADWERKTRLRSTFCFYGVGRMLLGKCRLLSSIEIDKAIDEVLYV